MIKSGYKEELYYIEDLKIETEELERNINSLLDENHGVGIIGGYYKQDFPICMVSELTLRMLGFGSESEFTAQTGGNMAGLVKKREMLDKIFSESTGDNELYLRGKSSYLRVRFVKHNMINAKNEILWIASVCDIDALYTKELLLDRTIEDKEHLETIHKAKSQQINRELARQKKALEHALFEAELNNEIISAISKIYWLIYRLDIPSGMFEEISVGGDMHKLTGNTGITAKRFPDACKKTVAPEYLEKMLEFTDVTTLPERLRDREDISFDYKTVTGNWHTARFIVQKRDEHGTVIKALYTIRLIDEQKRRELEYEEKLAKIAKEAQNASLSKTDFLRRMSHDIRTPINGIRGMIEIANHFVDDPEKQKVCRDKIWKASGYLLSLVNSVLDMNKLESGVIVLNDAPFDIVQLLSEVASIAEMQATEHGLSFTLENNSQYIKHRRLIGSAQHVKQVLMNIAENAVKYNKQNGNVTVRCKEISCDGETAVFEFVCADTGIGMSEEFQKRAFEPFSQEGQDKARTHYDGSGLGLSIAKTLVEQMGGCVKFTSNEGDGTTFNVTIPFKLDPSPANETISEADENIDLSGVRVLLVEDNDLNMEISKFFIEQSGAHVTPAKNGLEGVNLFKSSENGYFDIVLMDVMMPVMDGYKATEKIRALERPDAKTVPIIAMSANAFQDDILKSKSAGMNEHLAKPISTKKLLSSIFRYVKHK